MKRLAAIVVILLSAGCSDEEAPPVMPDTAPPTVVSTYPAVGETGVPRDVAISATFSEAMDRWTFSDSTFVISAGMTGTIQYENRTVTLTPFTLFQYNKTYTAVITTGVTDVAGNPLAENYVWSFKTTPGVIMPLAVGNRWEFMILLYDDTGVLQDTAYDTIRIVSDVIFQDSTWYVDDFGARYANRSDGLWMISSGGTPYLYLKFPATGGESYNADPDVSEVITVTGTSVMVTTPNNFYICHAYRSTSADPVWMYRFYYAPNIGPVAIERVRLGAIQVLKERWLLLRVQLAS